MRIRPAAAEATVMLQPSRDERLIPYCIIVVGSLAITVVTGQPALAALAVPFALALTVGLRVSGPIRVTGRIVVDAEQVLEGDIVTGRIELRWPKALDARIRLHRLQGVAVDSPEAVPEWAVAGAAGALVLPIRLQASRWGRHLLGEVWVRLSAPHGLLTWTGKVVAGPTLRVLPGSERLTRLLDPSDSRTVIGAHRSRRLGDGHEFADLRPYAPGDRLRDLNWRATGRLQQPFVNRHHRELSGDVVIAVDAFGDGSAASVEALTRAARAGWALAAIHLQANDRVGLAGLGSGTRWLPPAGGRRAKYQLLEALLGIGGEANDADREDYGRGRTTVPPAALIIALTPLHEQRTVRLLQGWRARGRSIVVAMIDTRDLLEVPRSAAEVLARRVWALELEGRRRALRRVGIPVVPMDEGGAVAPVVSALRRARQAPGLRAAR